MSRLATAELAAQAGWAEVFAGVQAETALSVRLMAKLAKRPRRRQGEGG